MVEENQVNLVKALQRLLEKQTELVRKRDYDTRRFDELKRQADVLVKKTAQAGILQRPEFSEQKRDLQKSYEQLNLALKAQKQTIVQELTQARKWKKTIQTYRKNV